MQQVWDLFPDIGDALDQGHLNNARGRNLLGCTIDAFAERAKDRLVCIHANDNGGLRTTLASADADASRPPSPPPSHDAMETRWISAEKARGT